MAVRFWSCIQTIQGFPIRKALIYFFCRPSRVAPVVRGSSPFAHHLKLPVEPWLRCPLERGGEGGAYNKTVALVSDTWLNLINNCEWSPQSTEQKGNTTRNERSPSFPAIKLPSKRFSCLYFYLMVKRKTIVQSFDSSMKIDHTTSPIYNTTYISILRGRAYLTMTTFAMSNICCLLRTNSVICQICISFCMIRGNLTESRSGGNFMV